MKKSTVNTILLVGAAAAAWFIFTSMKKRRGSSVEAGSPIKQTEAEFEAEYAEVVKPKPSVLDTVKNVLQTIKRSPEKKTAAQKKKAVKIPNLAKYTLEQQAKAPKPVFYPSASFKNIVENLNKKSKKKKVAGFDNCTGLY
jgi:hypothetical protein